MKNKINIAELLKDCPKGMELDCAIYENVTLVEVKEGNDYPIVLETPNGQMLFSKYGCFLKNELAKCIIYPKGKTTWEGFIPPCKFKDGDIVTWKDRTGSLVACIYKERLDISFKHHIALYKGGLGIIVNGEIILTNDELCLATEEEKEKLFQAIKDNGYKWNAETKTLEKLVNPRFKIGNRIKYKTNQYEYTIIDITKDNYIVRYKTDNFDYHVPFWDEDNYDLVHDKFDVTTLKPFESRVLVRHNKDNKWCGSFFSHIDGDFHSHCYKFVTIAGKSYPMCIPYEKNEHLLGTTNDCDEYFKNW